MLKKSVNHFGDETSEVLQQSFTSPFYLIKARVSYHKICLKLFKSLDHKNNPYLDQIPSVIMFVLSNISQTL